VDDIIPPDVREFIIKHIDTVSELEALLILRTTPDEYWSQDRLAARVYASERDIAEMLKRFTAQAFLERKEGQYRYNRDAPADRVISDLAQCYASHLIPITNMIHGKPRSMRSFSDAFKLRRDS
jgi:hypothetical protein